VFAFSFTLSGLSTPPQLAAMHCQMDVPISTTPEYATPLRTSQDRRWIFCALVLGMLFSIGGCVSVPVMAVNFAKATTLNGRCLPPQRQYLVAFRQPSQFNAEGLYLLQPYESGRIPLVLIHGLASDAFTWDDIVFAMNGDPIIRQRYQIWVYQYPTGVSYLYSSAHLRQELIRARQTLDPDGKDSAFDETVLVGHSMGGLLARLQISHSDDRLWRAVSNLPMEQTIRSGTIPEAAVKQFVFDPVPFVKRVVYIATPHLGSNWTVQPLGQFSRWLIELPKQVRDDWRVLVRRDLRFNSPADPPTSLDHLTPGNPIINATASLREATAVSRHSIIGTGYLVPDGYLGDGVVPIVSARRHNVSSERFVRATHSGILRAPDAMTELIRLLRE
jgi:pimeloyl-ACP methyl ester carboxylesterase